MENLHAQIIDYLLTQSWQIGVLAVAIAAVSLAVKNKSAHVRYLLWLIVLAKCLVPPLYTITLAVLPQQQTPEPVVSAAAEIPAVAVMVEAVPTEPVTLPSRTVLAPPVEPSIAERLGEVTFRQWLAFVWIVGVGVFVLAAVIKALRVNQWLRRERRALPAKLQSEIEKLFAELGVKTVPKVWLVKGIGQPFVWGLLRGSIYLPGNFVDVTGDESRRGVLGHELSHILRFDAAVNLLQIIAQAIFWFHPFVWWANKKIRAEREKCCDEMAIARLGAKAKDYSSAIVNTLIAEHEATLPIPSLAIAGPVKNIEDRIKTIMNPGKKFYKRPSLIAAITVLLLASLAVPTTLALTARKDTSDDKFKELISPEDLVAEIIKSERKIRNVELHMICTIPERNLVFYEYDWGYEGGKEFYSGIANRGSETNGYRAVKVKHTYDGQRQWLFRDDPAEMRPEGGILKTTKEDFESFRGFMTPTTLLGFDAKELSRLSLGEALAQAESVSVRKEIERIDGHPCRVIEAINVETDPTVKYSYDVRAWIDIERDFRPLKIEKCRSVAGKNKWKIISRRIENIKLKKISGIWFPIEGERTTFSVKDWTAPEGMSNEEFNALSDEELRQKAVYEMGKMLPTRKLKIKVDSIKINEGIPPGKFTVTFPVGCEVWDEFSKKRYIVTETPLQLQSHLESAHRLSGLGKALFVYANDDEKGRFPDTLEELHQGDYISGEDSEWLLENVEYLGKGKTATDPPNIAIAYDKALLEKGKGTNVLFLDSHIAFKSPEQLEKLGIRGEIRRRHESEEKLKALCKALIIYANEDEKGKLPDTLQQLHKGDYVSEKDLEWFLANIEYLGKRKTAADPPDTMIAFDKALLEKGKGTNVLFLDGHVAFERPEQLEKLVIAKSAERKTKTSRRWTDIDVYKQLDEIVELSGWKPEMSFSEALEELKNSVEPLLKIVVLWGDLAENADIEQSTQINLGPLPPVRLSFALELLLKSVSSGLAMAEVGYAVEDGV